MYRRDAPSASRGKGKRRRRFFRVSLAGVVVPDGGGQRRGRGFLGQKVCAGSGQVNLLLGFTAQKSNTNGRLRGPFIRFPTHPRVGCAD